MKFSLSWLKEHLDTQVSVADLTDRLTMLGLEVEDVVDRGAALRDFVAAQVIDVRPHPNANKLHVCIIDTGTEHVKVVCGANNVKRGMKAVYAAAGSFIPGSGTILQQTAIRGIDSAGMLLSEREMQLSDDHGGIVELPAETQIGEPAVEALGLTDPVIDLAITPNRSDCLGIRGVARDLAAARLGTLKPLDAASVPGCFNSSINVELALPPEAREACPYFVGRMIRNVQNRESPCWLKQRLQSAGLRPISALVDITNYVMLDLSRPLHVFDADRLTGEISVRLARAGETLAALNGKTYVLSPEMTVVADAAGPQALGGVIGGEATACELKTTNIFVECAIFDPVRTAATGRMLNIVSDARYRFERGIDPAGVLPGIEIATRMILELCGGEASGVVIVGEPPPHQAFTEFRPARVRELAGVDVRHDECERALRSLGFEGEMKGETWSLQPPSWRNDIFGEACVVEEVVRILGYDRIPAVALPMLSGLPKTALNALQRRRGRARRALASRGLTEAVTYSFVSGYAAAPFTAAPECRENLRIVNPISADLDVMRPTPLPGLILAAQRNADRGQRDAALFEVGPQYTGDGPADQTTVAVAIRSGRTGDRHWAQSSRGVDVFDAKADALAILEVLGVSTEDLRVIREVPRWYHPGRAASLQLENGLVLANFGEINPRVLRILKAAPPLVACEVFVDSVPDHQARSAARPPLDLPALQPVERDFAFVVNDDVAADMLVRAALSADPGVIAAVRVFDVFTGDVLEAGTKSIAITVVLQPVERTLTDAVIDALADKVVTRVRDVTGGRLRA